MYALEQSGVKGEYAGSDRKGLHLVLSFPLSVKKIQGSRVSLKLVLKTENRELTTDNPLNPHPLEQILRQ